MQIKKSKFVIITFICIIILLSLTTNVFAERYAYSAGTNWLVTEIPEYKPAMTNNFTTNVKNSWLHYSSIPNMTAKMEIDAFTKDDLNGTIDGELKKIK